MFQKIRWVKLCFLILNIQWATISAQAQISNAELTSCIADRFNVESWDYRINSTQGTKTIEFKKWNIELDIPLIAIEEFYKIFDMIKIKNNRVTAIYFSDLNDCFHHFFREKSKEISLARQEFKIDVEDLYSNKFKFGSNELKTVTRILTGDRLNFFVVFFEPLEQDLKSFSWTFKNGTTILTIPLSGNRFSKLLTSPEVTNELNRYTDDLVRQFYHEYYIKKDVVQTLGRAIYSSIDKIYQDNLKKFVDIARNHAGAWSFLENDNYRSIFANYRGKKFEELLGLSEVTINDKSCVQIIEDFQFRFSLPEVDPFYQAAMDLQNALFGLQMNAFKKRQNDKDFNIDEFENGILCERLKTPLWQTGPNVIFHNDGPGCPGCATAD